MKQIIFLVTILVLSVNPILGRESAGTNEGYHYSFNGHSNGAKVNSRAAGFRREANHSTKGETVFLYSVSPGGTPSNEFISRQAANAKDENQDFPTEEFSFLIQDFKMNHQSEVNNLNIKVRYRYEIGILDSEYPDFRAILKDIEDFLNNYPNKVDYWEILNKKLTQMVLKKYPVLAGITSEIQVSSSQKVSYIRTSTVTRSQSKRVKTK